MRIRITRQFGPFDVIPLGLNFNAKEIIIEGEHFFPARASLKIQGWKIVSLEKRKKGHPLFSAVFLQSIG
jgi:hypothetical protein